MATAWQFTNWAKSTILGSHSDVVTTITLVSGQGARWGTSFPQKAVIWEASGFPDPADAGNNTPTRAELVHVTGRSTDQLTVVRAQEGTTGLDMTDTSKTYLIMATVSAEQYASLDLQWENVKGYGAVGDGVTNDTQAVIDAIDAATEGGTIYFPLGSYNLSTWPSAGKAITKSLRFIGEEESILTGAAGTDFLSVRDSVIVDSLKFSGWDSIFKLNDLPASTTVDRLEVQNCRSDGADQFMEWSSANAGAKFSLIRIENCRIINSTGNVIEIASDLTPTAEFDHLMIRGNVIDGGVRGIHVGTNVTGLAGSAPSSEASKWKRITITENHVVNIDAQSGATNGVGIIVYGEYVNISNNTIDGVTGGAGASSENWGIYTKARFIVTSYNIVRNVNDDTVSVGAVGIDIKGADRDRTVEGWPPPDDAKSEGPFGYDRVCIGNVVNMGLATTLTATGIKVNCEDVICARNLVEACTGSGISTLGDSVPHDRITISGNHVKDGDSNSSGILMQNPASSVHIDDNIVENHFVGIQWAPTGTNQTPAAINPTGWSCRGNTIVAGTNGGTDGVGIRFNHQKTKISGECRDIRVQDNYIRDFQGTLGAAISFANDDNGDYDNVWIAGNIIRNCRVISGSYINFGVTPTNLHQELQGQVGGSVEYRSNLQLVDGAWNGAHLVVGASPNDFHVWQDGTNLRWKKGAPASAGDGTAI